MHHRPISRIQISIFRDLSAKEPPFPSRFLSNYRDISFWDEPWREAVCFLWPTTCHPRLSPSISSNCQSHQRQYLLVVEAIHICSIENNNNNKMPWTTPLRKKQVVAMRHKQKALISDSRAPPIYPTLPCSVPKYRQLILPVGIFIWFNWTSSRYSLDSDWQSCDEADDNSRIMYSDNQFRHAQTWPKCSLLMPDPKVFLYLIVLKPKSKGFLKTP